MLRNRVTLARSRFDIVTIDAEGEGDPSWPMHFPIIIHASLRRSRPKTEREREEGKGGSSIRNAVNVSTSRGRGGGEGAKSESSKRVYDNGTKRVAACVLRDPLPRNPELCLSFSARYIMKRGASSGYPVPDHGVFSCVAFCPEQNERRSVSGASLLSRGMEERKGTRVPRAGSGMGIPERIGTRDMNAFNAPLTDTSITDTICVGGATASCFPPIPPTRPSSIDLTRSFDFPASVAPSFPPGIASQAVVREFRCRQTPSSSPRSWGMGLRGGGGGK